MQRTALLVVFSVFFACSSGSKKEGADIAAELPSVVDVAADKTAELPSVDLGVPPEVSDVAPELPYVPPDPVTNGGVEAHEEGGTLIIENGVIEVQVQLDSGLVDVLDAGGAALVLGAESRMQLEGGGPKDLMGQEQGDVFGTSEAVFMAWEGQAVADALGEGVQVAVTWEHPGGLTFRQRLELRGDSPVFLARATVTVPAGGELVNERVLQLSPFVADADTGGGLFLGADPSQHLVVDNGSDMFFDFAARVYRVGKGESLFFPPGSVANWNACIYDPDTEQSIVAGFMTFDRGVGLIGLDYEADSAPRADARAGFTRFEAFTYFSPPPNMKDGTDGVYVDSEVFYVDFAPETPFDGLENYASRFAAMKNKTLWTDIPTSWNSWGGGGGEGGLGTNINEEIILANLDAMEEDFYPFGMNYFVIDNGWEVAVGDWDTHPERFPDHDGVEGMEWMAGEIESRGMIPGIWIAPFWVSADSQLAKDHPDWLAPKSEFGGFLMGDGDLILDLTNPEVLDWLSQLMHKITQEWGFKWIKMDFAYYALFASELMDSTKNASEAYVDGINVMREAMGPETFFLTISAMGLSFTVGDGGRTTLDNMPEWGDDGEQGTKVTLMTASHRYYLNWLWSNHHDLVYYRDDLGMTMGEARCWTSVVCLMGGIFKIGDKFTELHEHPDRLEMARVAIPVYPRSARPLDMFELRYPEVWAVPVAREGKEWHVVGLYNWGLNELVATGKETPEETKTKSLDLSEIGLDPNAKYLSFSAWDRTCQWEEDGVVEVELEPRTDAIFVVRPESQEPEIVFTTRHLLGGAVEVSEETLAEEDGELVLRAKIDSPAGHEFEVFVDTVGLKVTGFTFSGAGGFGSKPCDGVQGFTLIADQNPTEMEVRFEK